MKNDNLPNSPVSNSLNRRDFLAKSALAAASAPLLGGLIVAPSGLRAADVATASGRIRLGVIGCGGMGKGDLTTFFMNPEVDCVVVCDVDDARIAEGVKLVEEKRGKRPDTTKDFRRVLDRRDVDAVLVATPDHWHALPTVLACQAGKDVYVEKPLATTIAEGRAMLDASRKHNRIVQMGTQWRSGKHWAEIAEFVRSGKLGKVGLVRGWAYHDWLGNIGNPVDGQPPAGVDYDMWLGPAPKRPFNASRFHFNFRWFWDYAGGLMTDWGVHLINVMLWAMGPEYPKTISSSGGKFVLTDNSETPDTQIAVYDFPNYTMVWEHKVGVGVGLNGKPWGISFTGSEGTLIARDDGWEIIPEPKKKSLMAKQYPGSGDARPGHVRNFLDCVKSRQQPNEQLSVGHHVSTVAHLGNVAFRCGRKIAWNAEKERIEGDTQADKLVGVTYRKPWKLPYYPRA
ncbi:MAG TPA: Gfo/Idh/MocA family oxidoreductase [Verrucomicrobiae bacterium]|nr:Gfo/Idh/MocA family oxidoreductase [Verrucomicrobiae bacterium]